MPRRHPALPACWLMTDERQGEALWVALRRLPKGSGVVFRHYSLPPAERRALFDRVRRIARARRLVLVLAGPPRLARGWRADGAHGRSPHRSPGLLRTAPVHDRRELVVAGGADLLFVSPVFATRSHLGARGLGRIGFHALARRTRQPVAALGGMTARRARSLGGVRWAAIDAWSSSRA
ncbi:thiamine phosphate synthase [Sphingomonas naphthae]|uniref:Thiamine phosphate synthase n=1 Tax=Sphingomonas naphthae TaxID=1813468 RepID=A0ABY7TK85_9SPHN|nr:thiamine phosphate synthase [Sphingomonas naphthae]WCT73196.1 thiamine phosphate synthase [Sphingomonas naphthae]